MPDKKPKASTLKSILGKAKYLTPGFGVPMLARDVASRFSLNRMAQNLDPYNYTTGDRSVVERFADAVLSNKKEADRAETEQYIEKGYGMKPGVAFKERVDLLQMLAGKPQQYNTIQESQYRPDKTAKEGVQYYSSKGLEDEIIKDLGLEGKDIRSAKDILDIITPIASIDPETGKRMIRPGGVVTTVPGLGQATYSAKRDPQGRIYLTYGDVWDLNPSKGLSAEQKMAPRGSIDQLKEMAMSGVKDAASYVVNAVSTPPNVYGRIYFDPKTGKPIRKP